MPGSVAPEEPRSCARQRRGRRVGYPHLCRRDRAGTAQAALAHASRAAILSELSATIAHEVKQPLAAIVTRAATGLRWLPHDQLDMAKVEPLLRPLRFALPAMHPGRSAPAVPAATHDVLTGKENLP